MRDRLTRYSLRLMGSASIGLAAAVFAANAGTEASTAATHAGFAANASDIAQVHMHLHHTVNCLVGPNGEGFDASEANPCASIGNGAIPDTDDPGRKEKLQKALEAARKGLATDDPAQAREQAAEAENALKAAA